MQSFVSYWFYASFNLELVRKGAVTVLDVRPAEEYNAGHIAGSISLPLKELEQRLSDLPRNQEIVDSRSLLHRRFICHQFPAGNWMRSPSTTDEYFELDLPVAPAVVVGDEILVEGTDVSKDRLEGAICRHLGLAEPLILNYYGFVSHISGGDPLDNLSIESLELGMITITPTPRYTISP